RRTRHGFALRVVGQNPEAAAAAGLHLGRVRTLAFALSGGLAGLGGANFVLGYKYYYEDGFSSGIGYLGIAVAVLAHNRPLWLLLSALFFGTLAQGGLAVNAVVPRELIDVLSATVILAVATASAEVKRLLPRFALDPAKAEPSPREPLPREPPPRELFPKSEPDPSEPVPPPLVEPKPSPPVAWVER
ncbi:MAG: ABC transporter permease, partial [Deltaproteobacteria bacterium]|nr:ABC transporter permease [Deltaproteobacteria bacterium]